MASTYQINEVFYSVQGEGHLAGTPMVFVRFSKCNMKCTVEPSDKSPGGFDCDTEFESGRRITLEELGEWITHSLSPYRSNTTPLWRLWLLLTGGEPGLQLDDEFIAYFKSKGWRIAVETNGSIELPEGLDWVCVSPKVAEHSIRQKTADEVKYVRGYGQALPDTTVVADHYLISPATNGLHFDQRTVDWCVDLVKSNPTWHLTAQLHKLWSAR